MSINFLFCIQHIKFLIVMISLQAHTNKSWFTRDVLSFYERKDKFRSNGRNHTNIFIPHPILAMAFLYLFLRTHSSFALYTILCQIHMLCLSNHTCVYLQLLLKVANWFQRNSQTFAINISLTL